MAQKLSAAFSI